MKNSDTRNYSNSNAQISYLLCLIRHFGIEESRATSFIPKALKEYYTEKSIKTESFPLNIKNQIPVEHKQDSPL